MRQAAVKRQRRPCHRVGNARRVRVRRRRSARARVIRLGQHIRRPQARAVRRASQQVHHARHRGATHGPVGPGLGGSSLPLSVGAACALAAAAFAPCSPARCPGGFVLVKVWVQPPPPVVHLAPHFSPRPLACQRTAVAGQQARRRQHAIVQDRGRLLKQAGGGGGAGGHVLRGAGWGQAVGSARVVRGGRQARPGHSRPSTPTHQPATPQPFPHPLHPAPPQTPHSLARGTQ